MKISLYKDYYLYITHENLTIAIDKEDVSIEAENSGNACEVVLKLEEFDKIVEAYNNFKKSLTIKE